MKESRKTIVGFGLDLDLRIRVYNRAVVSLKAIKIYFFPFVLPFSSEREIIPEHLTILNVTMPAYMHS